MARRFGHQSWIDPAYCWEGFGGITPQLAA
jgi:hypothetical protein